MLADSAPRRHVNPRTPLDLDLNPDNPEGDPDHDEYDDEYDHPDHVAVVAAPVPSRSRRDPDPDDDDDLDLNPDPVRDEQIRKEIAARKNKKAKADPDPDPIDHDTYLQQIRDRHAREEAETKRQNEAIAAQPRRPKIEYGPDREPIAPAAETPDRHIVLRTMGRPTAIPEWVPAAVVARMEAAGRKQQANGILANLFIIYAQLLYWADLAAHGMGQYTFQAHPEGESVVNGKRGYIFLTLVRRELRKRLAAPKKGTGRFKLRRALDKLVELGLIAWPTGRKSGITHTTHVRIVYAAVVDCVTEFCDRYPTAKKRAVPKKKIPQAPKASTEDE